jgi:hypothetical protein
MNAQGWDSRSNWLPDEIDHAEGGGKRPFFLEPKRRGAATTAGVPSAPRFAVACAFWRPRGTLRKSPSLRCAALFNARPLSSQLPSRALLREIPPCSRSKDKSIAFPGGKLKCSWPSLDSPSYSPSLEDPTHRGRPSSPSSATRRLRPARPGTGRPSAKLKPFDS